MTDDQHPNSASFGSPDNNDRRSVPEEDFDDALAKAASLASELSAEVGEASTHTDSSSADAGQASVSEITDELDAELANLERLVGAASAQVTPQTTAHNAVPAFMADLAGPESLVEPDSASHNVEAAPLAEGTGQDAAGDPAGECITPNDRAEAVGPSSVDVEAPGDAARLAEQTTVSPQPGAQLAPSIGGFEAPGVVGNIPKEARLAARPEPSCDREEREDDKTQPDDNAGGPIGRVTQALFVLGERAVELLERIDRPFSKLGNPVRRMVGLIAIATLGTSLIVFLMSMF